MLQNATTSYLYDQKQKSSTQKLSERLRNALDKYYLNADTELVKLKVTYEEYTGHEQAITEEKILSKSIVKAFSSFNIAPSGSYERYLSGISNRSDVEAIRSDWESVGNDLTFVLAGQLLESK